jgi:hypothetical protein
LIRSTSIQNRWPHCEHFKRYRGSISLILVHKSSATAASTSLLKATMPSGPRTKT